MSEGGGKTTGRAETLAGPRRAVEVFTWPPKPAEADPRGEDGPAASEGAAGARPAAEAWGRGTGRWAGLCNGFGSVWNEAEGAWLGVSAVSWREAARRAGWVADQPGDYCPRCGTSAGPYEADADGCPACRRRRLAWSRSVRLGSYEGVLREAILAGKYTGWRRVCQEIGADLGLAVAAALGASGVDPAGAVVCPVPTSTRRRLSRGVDHTVVMAREVARATGGELVRGLRRRHGPAQAGLAGAARQRNVAGVFLPRSGVCQGLGGRVVVLVDDVRTTGATLSAASRALQGAARSGGGAGASIWAAVAGVTARSGENRHEQ